MFCLPFLYCQISTGGQRPTGDKALTQVVLCHTTHTATSTHLKEVKPHTQGQKAPGKRPVYDKESKAGNKSMPSDLRGYLFTVVRKGRKFAVCSWNRATPTMMACRGRLGNVQFDSGRSLNLAWKTPRGVPGLVVLCKLPPIHSTGLAGALASFLQLQSPAENEALMLKNHSETESDTL